MMIEYIKDFNLKETIFIDANIFSYHHLNHPKFGEICTKFLQRVENGEINAVTSSLVIDEVAFVILVEKGCEILKTDKTWKVKERIKEDKEFAKNCYEAVKQFLSYINFLQEIGLSIVEIRFEDINLSTDIASQYMLLPHDAIHISVMKKYGIKNIATADPDFIRVKEIKVWKP
ncbi:MAG: hypothetical protein DRP10_03600 [Candidatus Aenigmatarchaeota archaeon]|nr:MAG: hypothetical protein DRP10_03600 [Candidatus Aenigmarchaeota archaeon]